jgi:uncharacterized protein (DUF736 family)
MGTGWCRGKYIWVQGGAGGNIFRYRVVQVEIHIGTGWYRGDIYRYRVLQGEIYIGTGWCRGKFCVVGDEITC